MSVCDPSQQSPRNQPANTADGRDDAKLAYSGESEQIETATKQHKPRDKQTTAPAQRSGRLTPLRQPGNRQQRQGVEHLIVHRGLPRLQQRRIDTVLQQMRTKGAERNDEEGVDGKEQIIHLAKQGDTLGYRAILSGDKYSCSALALEDASLCFIAKDVFYSLVEKNAGVALQIINLFSKELKDAERKITSFAQNSIKERLAQSLLLLKENYGLENDGYTINASVTREEIANITGTTRETAIRNLFELNDDGIIELKGKKIKIISLHELIKTANVFD